ncbi:hypothetical protein FOL47_002830 [Perkinsus chesapeaki]|uniref:Uncharacterized protein n=1 Tax=Perkinsus chesapeaki TaxID=330153 RepID=A0A7J6MB84_PERCH|nr:hypothetical protein FOL47_002830 [Perkinsus chesapeaki]
MKAPSILFLQFTLLAALLFALQGCSKQESSKATAVETRSSGLFLNNAGSLGSQSCHQANQPYSLRVDRLKNSDGTWSNSITADCGNAHRALKKTDADLPEAVKSKLLDAKMSCNDIWEAFGTKGSASAISLRSMCREALGVSVPLSTSPMRFPTIQLLILAMVSSPSNVEAFDFGHLFSIGHSIISSFMPGQKESSPPPPPPRRAPSRSPARQAPPRGLGPSPSRSSHFRRNRSTSRVRPPTTSAARPQASRATNTASRRSEPEQVDPDVDKMLDGIDFDSLS